MTLELEYRVEAIEKHLGINQPDMRECWGDAPKPKPTVESLLKEIAQMEDDFANTLEHKHQIENKLKKMTEKYDRSVSYTENLITQREYWKGFAGELLSKGDNDEPK